MALAVTGNAVDFVAAARFIRGHTHLCAVLGVPEIRLLQADDSIGVWEATERDVSDGTMDPPFWAFAWAGGLPLARWIIDNPSVVSGRAVVDVATGSGLVAIAAALSGAASVTAIDIDPLATVAARLNAEANGVEISVRQCSVEDLPEPAEGTVVVAGDVFYERAMALTMRRSLQRFADGGCDVFIGDPRRIYLPEVGLTVVDEFDIDVDHELEDASMKRAVIARVDRR